MTSHKLPVLWMYFPSSELSICVQDVQLVSLRRSPFPLPSFIPTNFSEISARDPARPTFAWFLQNHTHIHLSREVCFCMDDVYLYQRALLTFQCVFVFLSFQGAETVLDFLISSTLIIIIISTMPGASSRLCTIKKYIFLLGLSIN